MQIGGCKSHDMQVGCSLSDLIRVWMSRFALFFQMSSESTIVSFTSVIDGTKVY